MLALGLVFSPSAVWADFSDEVTSSVAVQSDSPGMEYHFKEVERVFAEDAPQETSGYYTMAVWHEDLSPSQTSPDQALSAPPVSTILTVSSAPSIPAFPPTAFGPPSSSLSHTSTISLDFPLPCHGGLSTVAMVAQVGVDFREPNSFCLGYRNPSLCTGSMLPAVGFLSGIPYEGTPAVLSGMRVGKSWDEDSCQNLGFYGRLIPAIAVHSGEPQRVSGANQIGRFPEMGSDLEGISRPSDHQPDLPAGRKPQAGSKNRFVRKGSSKIISIWLQNPLELHSTSSSMQCESYLSKSMITRSASDWKFLCLPARKIFHFPPLSS